MFIQEVNMGITIGIDLGTTNSVMSIKKIGISTILNAEGEELTPSSVTAISNGSSYDYIVGRSSRHLLKQYPTQTITSIKRLIGREFDDIEIQNLLNDNRISYNVTTDPLESGSIRISLGDKMQTPEMISGMILNKLIRDAETQLQGKIDQAVVTVPAYFSDQQKFATRAACDYAGIKLLRLLPEPTAAALSFGLSETNHEEHQTIMVFDLGGGTFDISILSMAGSSFMEISKGGDMWLGGDDIDKLLVDYIFSCAQKKAGCKPIPELIENLPTIDKARFLIEIKEKAEAAKIALSTQDSTTVDVFGVLKDENNQYIDIDVNITRDEFNELLNPILQRISHITKQILHEIRFEPELIDTVLMVGGSSIIPAIQDELKKIFSPGKVLSHPRPMLAVAEGAALMASKITSQEKVEETDQTFSMMHSTAHDYYLQLANGKRHLLIARNSPLPAAVEETLAFSHVDQKLARLRVFNDVNGVLETVGELWFHKEVDHNTQDPAKLTLRFTVDEDNIITMKASSLQNTNTSTETQIARGGLAKKLYHDLESTLSSIISQAKSIHVEQDALKLSQLIVSTILSASDPTTGETRIDQKQKVQQQIQTLKLLQQHDIAPISGYGFGKLAEEYAASILSEKEHSRLQKILHDYDTAITSLNDINHLIKMQKTLEAFFDEVPVAADLARAGNVAALLEKEAPHDAKHIRNQAKKLSDAYLRQDKIKIKEEQNALMYVIHSNFSMNSTPEGRFDRDVRL